MVYDKYKAKRQPENACEALAEPTWMTESEIIDGDDWKAITIINKAKVMGLI